MKQTIASFVTTSLFAAGLMFAQGPANRPGGGDPVARRVAFLTTLLTLTADQQQQATTLFTNASNGQSAVRDSMRTARQSLQTAIKNNDVNGIEQAATTIGNLTGQMTATQAKADAAFYQILTPEQQTKLSQLRSQGMGMGGMRGGPMGGGQRGMGRGRGPA